MSQGTKVIPAFAQGVSVLRLGWHLVSGQPSQMASHGDSAEAMQLAYSVELLRTSEVNLVCCVA